MRPGSIAAFGLAAAALMTRGAAADDRRPPLRLEYDAPAGCPSAQDFAQQVDRRRSRDGGPDGASPAPSRRLRVEIRRAARGMVGHLVLVGPDGRPSERSVAAADCRGVASVLALIAALALDRDGSPQPAAPATTAPAITGPAPTPAAPAPAPPAPAAPPAVAAPTPPPGPERVTQEPAPRPASPARPEADRTARPPAAPAPAPAPVPAPAPALQGPGADRTPSLGRRVPVAFSATAAGLLTGGMAPEPTTGWTALAGLSIGRDPPPWRVAPALLVRAGVAGALTRTFSDAGGAASFDWIAGIAEACPIALGLGFPGQLRPCVVGEYGVVRATGSDTMNPAFVTRPWAAAGVELRLSWTVLGPVSLDASVGALVSIERDRFTLGPYSVFETPPVVARGALGLGLALP